jgi:cell division protein ZapA
MSKDSMVKVTIFGTEYRVRGDANADSIHEIANYVDSTMRAIADSGRHVAPLRIAVLAAFNMAAEVRAYRQQGSGETVPVIDDNVNRLLKLFDEEQPDGEKEPEEDS